jgi:hypothetical protein
LLVVQVVVVRVVKVVAAELEVLEPEQLCQLQQEQNIR